MMFFDVKMLALIVWKALKITSLLLPSTLTFFLFGFGVLFTADGLCLQVLPGLSPL